MNSQLLSIDLSRAKNLCASVTCLHPICSKWERIHAMMEYRYSACALWGHIGRMTLTWPLRASHCALHKHTVQVHYLCYDLGRKANIFFSQSSGDSHIPNMQLKWGQDSRSTRPKGHFNVIEHDTSGKLHTHARAHTHWHKCSQMLFIIYFFFLMSL